MGMPNDYLKVAAEYSSNLEATKRRNWRVLAIGSILTALTTVLLFLISWLIPIAPIRSLVWEYARVYIHGNPFTSLRLVGGFSGPVVVGYFVRDHLGNRSLLTAVSYGAVAGAVGVVIVYIVLITYNVVSAALQGYFPPPLLTILITPALLVFPLVLLYSIEGVLAGTVGMWLGQRHE